MNFNQIRNWKKIKKINQKNYFLFYQKIRNKLKKSTNKNLLNII